MPVSDTLLRLAEERCFFKPKWSRTILDEVVSTLKRFGYSPEQALRRRSSMENAFPEAMIYEYESLTENLTIDPKDRHVLAAAIVCRADAIVTANLRDFPVEILNKFGIKPISPDDFLVYQLHLDAEELAERVEDQAAAIDWTLDKLLSRLQPHVPQFVSALAAFRRAD